MPVMNVVDHLDDLRGAVARLDATDEGSLEQIEPLLDIITHANAALSTLTRRQRAFLIETLADLGRR